MSISDEHRCNICGSTRFLFDAVARRLDCIDCNWKSVLIGSAIDELSRPQRCVAVASYGGLGTRRCSKDAHGWSDLCRQHQMGGPIEYLAAHGLPDPGAYRDPTERIYAEAIRHALDDSWVLKLETERRQPTPDEVREVQRQARTLRHTMGMAKRDEVVYFCRRESLIKIGTTTNVTKMMAAISRGSCMPEGMTIGPVELLATTPGGCQFENKLHHQFADDRVSGEWFRPSPRLLRLIDRYRRRDAEAEIA